MSTLVEFISAHWLAIVIFVVLWGLGLAAILHGFGGDDSEGFDE